jgi:flavin reductase (DIM6/NTAB) family NADH-FMN oxidoreductase RutF
VDEKHKKEVLKLLTYGLYVLTSIDGEEIAAGTVSWFSQASFTPPLVFAAIKVDSRLHSVVDRSRLFAVNILRADQKEIASAFFRSTELSDGLINGYAFEPGSLTKAPLLIDLPAWLEARVVDSVKGGDHSIYVAEVINAGIHDPQARPLELWDTGWSYGG